MMSLNKRYKRNVKQNLSFYICITLLTLMTVLLYILISGGVKGEGEFIDKFRSDNVCEDANFTTYNKMSDDDISKLEDEFDMQIEQQKYSDFDEDEYTVRIFRPSEKINKYLVTEGNDISSDNDILLSTSFAEANDIKIGDEITLGEKTFNVTGFCEKPDYLIILKELTDNYYVAKEFGIAVVKPEVFDTFEEENITNYFSAKFNKDNEDDFRKTLYDDFFTSGYIKSSSNTRIISPLETIDKMKMISNTILPIMLIFVVLIMAVILGRRVKNEQKYIGVLSALGYKKRELALHYSLFGVIPGFIGSIIGILLAVPIMPNVQKLLFKKIEPLPTEGSMSVVNIAVSLLIPSIVFGFFATITSLRIMRADTVDMLHCTSSKKSRSSMRMSNSKLNFRVKFMLRSILGKNISRTLVLLVGLCIGGVVLVFSYATLDSLQKYVDESVNKAGNFEYEYFLNTIETEKPDNGSPVLSNKFESEGSEDTIMLMGIDDNSMLDLKTRSSESVTVSDDEWYISSMGSMAYGVKKGDKFKFFDVCSLKEFEVVITDIVENNSQSVFYGSRSSACELIGVPENSYNVVLSDTKLDYTDSQLISVITKQGLKDQIQAVYDNMASLVGVLVLFGLIICVITVYLMVNMIITENAASVSMLKVLGYHSKEINRILVNVYHCLVPIGILLGLAVGFNICKRNFDNSVAAYNTYIETVITPVSIIKFAVLVLASYIISLLLVKRKVKRISMVDSLKDNRE